MEQLPLFVSEPPPGLARVFYRVPGSEALLRATIADSALPHQIRIVKHTGYAKLHLTCNCRPRHLVMMEDDQDCWEVYNQFPHQGEFIPHQQVERY